MLQFSQGFFCHTNEIERFFIGLASVQIQPPLEFLLTHELVCCYYYGPEEVLL